MSAVREEMQPSWLWERLGCPRHRCALIRNASVLCCLQGDSFPIVAGIPVLVTDEFAATHPALDHARKVVGNGALDAASPSTAAIDPYVVEAVAGTCGNLYSRLPRGLFRYPIPRLPLEPGGGRLLLDIGSNWGRWSLGAAQAGWRPVCLDPNLESLLAAHRVARQLGQELASVVADARQVPILDSSFDAVFSYSVLQHFSKEEARRIAQEMARVCAPGGLVISQMPNRYGIRQALNRWKHLGRSERNGFRVQHWVKRELRDLFGPDAPGVVEVDGWLSLNARPEDSDLLSLQARAVVRASVALTALSRKASWLGGFADSFWVRSRKPSLDRPRAE